MKVSLFDQLHLKLISENKRARFWTKYGVNVNPEGGVTSDSNCIVGAGTVVTRDVPDHSVVAGVPTRYIEPLEEYIEKNKSYFIHTKGMSSDAKKHLLGNAR